MAGPAAILITGASSGLGTALAKAYAAPGVRLVLFGRDAARLTAVAGEVRARGAAAETVAVDVTDQATMAAAVTAADEAGPLDLVIANAGVGPGSAEGDGAAAKGRRILAVNLDGVLNTVDPIRPRMAARGAGQIALMSSLAGFHGFPGMGPYTASKAAVRVYGEALRVELRPRGVRVSVVCPGFIRTPMTDGAPFPMPMMMEGDAAAVLIRHGLERGRPLLAFPWPIHIGTRLLAALPAAWGDALIRRVMRV
ncbi:SDR family NAD(P)-dependent oxidoreductase [Inquilinus limosus]|uniref:Short-chain dehydrogenase n=1 Tax=Inquilinus limosus TaxID=171674 RepID=A0A211ZPD7_9PROT|nr:SDR family NAD(P)-dependent oxidoreductase [Inquilinus limosus]OWJ67135.1 short-chain dehydrogenase [Inquilinus limosus]